MDSYENHWSPHFQLQILISSTAHLWPALPLLHIKCTTFRQAPLLSLIHIPCIACFYSPFPIGLLFCTAPHPFPPCRSMGHFSTSAALELLPSTRAMEWVHSLCGRCWRTAASSDCEWPRGGASSTAIGSVCFAAHLAKRECVERKYPGNRL